jgi:hypothetical protein
MSAQTLGMALSLQLPHEMVPFVLAFTNVSTEVPQG